jgi:hypothetical protein
VHKPRDRLHYEAFRQFHACFYRAVEATSVTPWAARAMDRALAAVVVAAARHMIPALTPDGAAIDIGDYRSARADRLISHTKTPRARCLLEPVVRNVRDLMIFYPYFYCFLLRYA